MAESFNSRCDNQISRPQTSSNHSNTRFRYQNHENEEQSPSLLTTFNSDQSNSKRTDEFPIEQSNKREKYIHHRKFLF